MTAIEMCGRKAQALGGKSLDQVCVNEKSTKCAHNVLAARVAPSHNDRKIPSEASRDDGL